MFRGLLDKSRLRKFFKGIQQGILKKEEEMVKRLIRKGYDDKAICDLTGVDIERVKEIRAKSIS